MAEPVEQPRPAVVEAVGVSKTFNHGTAAARQALRDINFKVADTPGTGEFITMVGPSGCGKSTLLNLIAGFDSHLPPTTGELKVFGEPVARPGADRGMVFQRYSSYPHLTVWQNIAFGLNLHRQRLGLNAKEIRDTAFEWAKKVRLTGSEHQYPRDLSGGMQQRVAIARSLALKPRILLMDEPFSALDEPTRLEMQDLLVELWRDNEATVFFVTHSILEAVYLGDRLWIFSAPPGTIARQIEDLPLPVEPAMIQQSRPDFEEYVQELSRTFMTITGRGGESGD